MTPAQLLLWELDNERHTVELMPAPEPKHSGHRVRVCTQSNPEWYREIIWSRTTVRGGKHRPTAKRSDVRRVLVRIADGQPVKGWIADALSEHLDAARAYLASQGGAA